jgi:hypothetical protein
MQWISQANRRLDRERITTAVIHGDARSLRVSPRDVVDSVRPLGVYPERQRPRAGDAVAPGGEPQVGAEHGELGTGESTSCSARGTTTSVTLRCRSSVSETVRLRQIVSPKISMNAHNGAALRREDVLACCQAPQPGSRQWIVSCYHGDGGRVLQHIRASGSRFCRSERAANVAS